MQSLECVFFKRANEAIQPKFDHCNRLLCQSRISRFFSIEVKSKGEIQNTLNSSGKKLSGNCKFQALWILSLYFIRSFSEDQKLTEEKFTTKEGKEKFAKLLFV